MLGLQGQAGDLGADGAVGGGAVALDGQAQLPGDGLVHVHDVAGGQRHVEQAVQARVQAGGDLAADGGLARADLAGDQADAAQLDQVLQARLGFAGGCGGEQVIGLRGRVEGVGGEAEVFAVHQRASSSSGRRAVRAQQAQAAGARGCAAAGRVGVEGLRDGRLRA